MYRLTSWCSPVKEATGFRTEPPSRNDSAARYSPAGHPSVRRCSSAMSSWPSVIPASRSSDDASARVSARSPGPISMTLPSARSRAIGSGGASRPASTSCEPSGTWPASTGIAARHSGLCSTCTSSRTSATGEVIDASAEPSRGTTEPGTELPGEASASNTRSSIGSTASSASAT